MFNDSIIVHNNQKCIQLSFSQLQSVDLHILLIHLFLNSNISHARFLFPLNSCFD